MNQMRKYLMLFLLIVLMESPVMFVSDSGSIEIDDVGLVYNVIDGDTFDAFPVGRVRLADIDAYECNTCIGDRAKSFLSSLIGNKTVYLDVDKNFTMDSYNRLVCVVYVRHNSTHVKNVNKALLDSGYATMNDFSNEFDWTIWTLYSKNYEDNAPQETYYELLSDYLELKSSHIELNYQHEDLLEDYSELNTTMDRLNDDFENLSENYTSLNSKHNELLSLHDELYFNYTKIKEEHQLLNASFIALQQAYEELQNESLGSKYEILLLESNILKVVLLCLAAALVVMLYHRKNR